MFVALIQKIEDDIDIALIKALVSHKVKEHLFTLRNNFRMIIGAVDLL
jgi:hypothetical protein